MTDDHSDDKAGFNWALRPREAQPSVPEPAVVEPAVTEPVEATSPSTSSGGEPPVTEPISAADIPTQAMPLPTAADIPTQAITQQDLPAAKEADDQATAAFTVPSWEPLAKRDPEAPVQGGEATTAIDSLFGETRFQEYDEGGVIPAIAPAIAGSRRAGRRAAVSPATAAEPFTTTQKTLMWAAIGLVAVLALVALFLLGTRIGAMSAQRSAGTSNSAANSSTTRHTPNAATTSGGMAAPGKRAWTALSGGECIQPFTSPWATTFTVVPCTAKHDAQLILTGKLTGAASAPYPSTAKLKSEIIERCTAPTALNYPTAGAASDIQLALTYPANEKDWKSGDRGFSCFAQRASGDALPGDLTAPAAG